MKSLKFLTLILCFQLAKFELLLTTCDDFPTCSPSACKTVSNSACVPTASFVNVSLAVSKITCSSSCVQSSLDLCASSKLAQIFLKGFGYGLKAAYCTDQYLVVHSDGMPNHDDSLSLIPRPPGDSSTGSNYGSQCVTRNWETQFFSFKIPLNPVALSTASASVNNVNSFIGNMLNGVALPKSGPVAISVTGLPIFPPYNDQTQLTWTACELDGCNAHVGQGFDYHYHGDPFSNKEGQCLYSPKDYESTTSHPPLIGFSADGFYLYGRYLSESAPGYSVPLDDCGGHEHDGYGYHYHSQVLTMQVTKPTPVGLVMGQNYTAFVAGPYKCWKGDISKFKGFWDTKGLTVAYGSSRNNLLSNLDKRSDYEYVKPCCNSKNYVKVPGVDIQGTV